ncbi:MAG: N-acetylmuramic acid 6-phosphate etherase [Planctomycetaceae bacterium]|nr:N-acetylmuramic acid 6-phosphate etherase [Planctomycetaceae bacterium]
MNHSDIAGLTTEGHNPASEKIDQFSSREIVEVMNGQDRLVAEAVGREADAIAHAIELIARSFQNGGRLFYLGAGTSGRLGVLDASECPPTFNTPPELVVGIIAGGPAALTRAVEGAEDHPDSGEQDLRNHHLTSTDIVVGIASSGRTPYVLGGLEYANQAGAQTIGISCNRPSQMDQVARHMIVPVVGPEIISGSTRLKAGTATKMVLNMLTTGAMIRIGKTFGNRMVDLRASNQKLMERTRRMVMDLTGLDHSAADQLLQRCDGELKTAVVVHHRHVSPDEARQMILASHGQLRNALRKSDSSPDSA